MQLKGSFPISADREHVFDLLNDPDVLAQILPGCKKLDIVDEKRYTGVIGTKVGPIDGEYDTTITLVEQDPPERYHIWIEGVGKTGTVNGNIIIELESPSESETMVYYTGHAQVSGRIARVGQRLIDAAAKMMAKRGFKALAQIAESERDDT